jgi:hypothetical protein
MERAKEVSDAVSKGFHASSVARVDMVRRDRGRGLLESG